MKVKSLKFIPFVAIFVLGLFFYSDSVFAADWCCCWGTDSTPAGDGDCHCGDKTGCDGPTGNNSYCNDGGSCQGCIPWPCGGSGDDEPDPPKYSIGGRVQFDSGDPLPYSNYSGKITGDGKTCEKLDDTGYKIGEWEADTNVTINMNTDWAPFRYCNWGFGNDDNHISNGWDDCSAEITIQDNGNHLWWDLICRPAVCGTVYVTEHGETDYKNNPLTCVFESGNQLIDVYMEGVQRASWVKFPTWTDVNGQDDLVWHDAEDQGGGVWKKTIDLSNHSGLGTVIIDTYVGGCNGTTFCSQKRVQKIDDPQSPKNLSVDNLICGATRREATVSWSYRDWDGYIPPATILRFDRLNDPLNSDGYQWVTENDTLPWVWTNTSRCSSVSGGVDCTYTYNDSTRRHGGGYGLLEGDYSWSAQAIDACTQDYFDPGSFRTWGPNFSCWNTAPDANGITGPDEVLYGDRVGFAASIYDDVDPMTWQWRSAYIPALDGYYQACGGSFNPSSGTNTSTLGYLIRQTEYHAPNTVSENNNCDSSNTPIVFSVTDSQYTDYANKYITLKYPLITGKIFDATVAGNCSTRSNNIDYFTTSRTPDLTARPMYGGGDAYFNINRSTGVYTSNVDTDRFPVGHNLRSMFLSSDDFDLPANVTVEIACADHLNPSFGTLIASGNYTIPGDSIWWDGILDPVVIDLGYELKSNLDGWFTVLEGGIYSGGAISMVTPEDSATYDHFMTDDYVLATGTLSSVAISGSGNYSGVSSSSTYAHDTSNIYVPFTSAEITTADATTISSTSDFNNLNPSVVYKTTGSTLRSQVLTQFTDYSGRIDRDGVVVILVEGDITFDSEFYSNDPDQKILFITDGSVTFGDNRDFGEYSPSGTGNDRQVGVSIFALGDISFPGVDTTPSNPDDPDLPGDSTLVIKGSLISGGRAIFNRNRTFDADGTLRNMYPGVAIHYDPVYVYYLQKQLFEGGDFEEFFLELIEVTWELEVN